MAKGPIFFPSTKAPPAQGAAVARSASGGAFDLPHRQLLGDRGWFRTIRRKSGVTCLRRCAVCLQPLAPPRRRCAAQPSATSGKPPFPGTPVSGEPLAHAVVWQCARGDDLRANRQRGRKGADSEATGIPLSPTIPPPRWPGCSRRFPRTAGACAGTAVLLHHGFLAALPALRGAPQTDYSNASRTQLFNIHTLQWD